MRYLFFPPTMIYKLSHNRVYLPGHGNLFVLGKTNGTPLRLLIVKDYGDTGLGYTSLTTLIDQVLEGGSAHLSK